VKVVCERDMEASMLRSQPYTSRTAQTFLSGHAGLTTCVACCTSPGTFLTQGTVAHPCALWLCNCQQNEGRKRRSSRVNNAVRQKTSKPGCQNSLLDFCSQQVVCGMC
jgi:hypothetical protein